MLRHRGIVNPVPLGLIQMGPRIGVTFLPHPEDVKAYLAKSQVPPSVQGTLLVDTGAQCTMVDDGVPKALGLTPVRYRPIIFGDGKSQDRPVYFMSIIFGMEDDAKRPAKAEWVGDVVGMDAKPQGHGGLLGRDFLSHFRLKYDGKTGTFELASDFDQSPEILEMRRQERHAKRLRQKRGGR